LLLFSNLFLVERRAGRLRLGLRRSPIEDSRLLGSLTIDVGEGFTTYGLLVLMMWLVADALVASAWLPRIQILGPLVLLGTAAAILLAKLVSRGTTYWLTVEVAAVLVLFLATADHPLTQLPGSFTAWVLATRASLEVAALVSAAGVAWLACAWTAFFILRRRSLVLGFLPMAAALGAEVINDPGQKGLAARVGLWLVLAMALLLALNLSHLRRRWGVWTDAVTSTVMLSGGRALVVLLGVAFIVPPLTITDRSAILFPNHDSRGGT